MHCPTCNYPLWNLSARVCPECGTAFRPSDFDFVVNSVRFCCPHCDQAYYGVGERGHLVPESYECTTCGTAIHMDETVLRPAEGLASEQTRFDRMPWLEREQRGPVRAWFGTIGAAMSRPTSLMRAIPPNVTSMQAWTFMYVSNVLFSILGLFCPAMIFTVVVLFLPASVTGGAGIGKMMAMQTLVVQATTLVIMAILPVLWAWLTHLLVGVGNPTVGPMNRTFHAICYSVGSNVLSVVPMDCTRLAGRIWWAVSAILMLKEGHRCSGLRASVAVLASGLVVGGLAVGAVVAMVFLLLGAAFTQGQLLAPSGEARTMTQAVLAYAATTGGSGPDHGARLVVANDLGTANFVSMDSATGEDQVPVGSTSLDRLAMLAPNNRRLAIQAAADALPEGTLAHRVGDFVFTYHGIDLSAANPALWIVVLAPDPDANGPPAPSTQIHLGQADGTVVTVSYSQMPIVLSSQNAMRRVIGLPPLPDPATVVHDDPAVGE